MKNWLGHFKTITTHKMRVMRHCFKVGLYRQGLLHDLSKYTPTEFLSGVKYYNGTKSPNEYERLEIGYSKAWLHHKGRNRHHLEYWIDYDPKQGGRMAGLRMPVNYVVEMFCDRIAACEIYQKEKYTRESPWKYYESSRDHYMIHPDTAKLLEELLLMLRDEGEEKTFSYIRSEILKNNREN
ncbi:MAG: catalase [Oscillospiraceae bacterium]|nr:catalase [Oscillospiraceae bacterium]